MQNLRVRDNWSWRTRVLGFGNWRLSWWSAGINRFWEDVNHPYGITKKAWQSLLATSARWDGLSSCRAN